MPEHAKLDTNSKVVPLEPEHQRIVRAKLARLPASVHSVHEKGKFLLLGLLKGFFDRADDSLFELADKALSNQEQNLYFDSMREVRVQRRGIEQRFAEAIDEAFAALVTPADAEEARPHFTPDTLSLVAHDELEEMVAVDSSVARANQECGEAIQLISLRLDSLVPVKVYQKNNPLGPDVVFSAFMTEAKKLDIGIKAKLVLFKLFDKAVVGRLNEVYSTVNAIFKEHNVLPSLMSSQGANLGRRRGDAGVGAGEILPGQGDASPGVDASMNPEVLSTLKHLLGERVVANTSVAPQTQAAANELIKLLSRVQQMPSVRDASVAINVRSLLAQLQQKAGARAAIGQVDDQVMNLVNLLFDFILEDRNLATPMKALISRMQIPIIKVAVADKTFFTKGGHVARRLLNELATAAIGWTGDAESARKDPLYLKIESIIRQLITDFDTDVAIFGELLADFSAFLEKEKKRAAVLERRTIDAEDGKARAEVARTTVALEIEIRTCGLSLPKVVSHLVNDAWSNVMFVTALKHGFESQEWETYLQVLEDLVWSVQTPRSLEQRQKLIQLVPNLLKKLRSGLDTISYNPFEMSDLFKSLEKVHIACIRGKPAAPAPAPSVKPVPAAPPQPKVEAAAADLARPLPEPSLRDLARGMEIAELDESAQREVVNDAVAAANASQASSAAAPTTLPASDPFMQQVSRFAQGMWFDMQDKRGQNTRCRLAAFIKPTGKYIFVNRNGMKVAEKTQLELALLLRENALSALDNSMLFDRALETVVSSLRKH